jgi:hypothetical protein
MWHPNTIRAKQTLYLETYGFELCCAGRAGIVTRGPNGQQGACLLSSQISLSQWHTQPNNVNLRNSFDNVALAARLLLRHRTPVASATANVQSLNGGTPCKYRHICTAQHAKQVTVRPAVLKLHRRPPLQLLRQLNGSWLHNVHMSCENEYSTYVIKDLAAVHHFGKPVFPKAAASGLPLPLQLLLIRNRWQLIMHHIH